MPITLPVATLIGTAAAGGAQAYGAHQAGKSATRASAIQERSDAAALEEARLQREEDRRRWDAEQALREREFQMREPYRQASRVALQNLGGLLGLNFQGGGGGPRMAGGGGGGMGGGGWMSPSNAGREGFDPYGRRLGDLLERR